MISDDKCQEEFFVGSEISEYALRQMKTPIGDRIRKLLGESGLLQKTVAHRAGLNLEAVNRIVRGKTPDPQWSTMVALLRNGLGVSLDEFEGGKPVSTVTPYDANELYRELIDALEDVDEFERERLARFVIWCANNMAGVEPATQAQGSRKPLPPLGPESNAGYGRSVQREQKREPTRGEQRERRKV